MSDEAVSAASAESTVTASCAYRAEDYYSAHQAVASRLVSVLRGTTRPRTVAWLNHYSALRLQHTNAQIDELDYLLVDGILLNLLLGLPTRSRTSADLVVPELLSAGDGWHVASIGATADKQALIANALQGLVGSRGRVAFVQEGYALDVDRLVERCNIHQPNLILVGLGAPRQERLAQELRQLRHPALVLTVGGYLDQLLYEQYYPRWAYPLRLNWLVRLAREPARLYARYTYWAAVAIAARRPLRKQLLGLHSLQRGMRLLETPDAAAG